MEQLNQRLDYLEETVDALRLQNRVLATALRGLIQALPDDWQADAVDNIYQAFEDEIAQLHYEKAIDAERFQDIAYDFFRAKS